LLPTRTVTGRSPPGYPQCAIIDARVTYTAAYVISLCGRFCDTKREAHNEMYAVPSFGIWLPPFGIWLRPKFEGIPFIASTLIYRPVAEQRCELAEWRALS
jgi:hypothetical protein